MMIFGRRQTQTRADLESSGKCAYPRVKPGVTVCLVIIALLLPLLSWAWVIGGFEVPAKVVIAKPRPAAVSGAGGSGR